MEMLGDIMDISYNLENVLSKFDISILPVVQLII